ncbi:MAG: hypothetical protein HDR45_04565 [Bacteroides sp.]|nr:hypothetical protein [Bacteroides sp.]
MGIIILLADLSRQNDLQSLQIVCSHLIKTIPKYAKTSIGIDFATGLSGIGWGLEYLVQHGLLRGPADDILRETDTFIMTQNIDKKTDFSLETGLLGLWNYIMARIQGNLLAGLTLPFTTKYLYWWLQTIESNIEKFPKNASLRLSAALRGNLIVEELNAKPFINKSNAFDAKDLSLVNGVAGLLYLIRI